VALGRLTYQMPAGCTSDGRPGFFNVVSTCTFVALPPHDPAVLVGTLYPEHDVGTSLLEARATISTGKNALQKDSLRSTVSWLHILCHLDLPFFAERFMPLVGQCIATARVQTLLPSNVMRTR